MRTLQTTLSDDAYEEILDALRKKTRAKSVRLPIPVVEKMIVDNTRMIEMLRRVGVQVLGP